MDAFGADGIPDRGSNLSYRAHHRRERLIIDIEDVPELLLRNHERMAGSGRGIVEEGERHIVLVDYFSRDFATDDF